MYPEREPAADGLNVTVIEHEVCANSDVPQLLVWVKSPLALMATIFNVAVPEFVTVTVFAGLFVQRSWFANVRLAGESETTPAVAVPARVTYCGLLTSESLTVTSPVRVPPIVGLKVTLAVQDAPAAIGLVHVLVTAKSPVMVMLLIVSVVAPWLMSVMDWAGLVVPTACAPKTT